MLCIPVAISALLVELDIPTPSPYLSEAEVTCALCDTTGTNFSMWRRLHAMRQIFLLLIDLCMVLEPFYAEI